MVNELLGNIMDKGAESILYMGSILGYRVVVKQRIEKTYRHPVFDEQFRYSRTKAEAKVLIDLFLNGLNVPEPILIDLDNYVIVMKYIEGKRLSDEINVLNKDKIVEYAFKLGIQVGKMHSLDIYHGDLTLANVLITRDEEVYLIDFGLAGYSRDVEEYAIDLHVLRRNLLAIAPDLFEPFFQSFLKGYRESYTKDYDLVIKRLDEIRLRGRYVEERLKRRVKRERYIEE